MAVFFLFYVQGRGASQNFPRELSKCPACGMVAGHLCCIRSLAHRNEVDTPFGSMPSPQFWMEPPLIRMSAQPERSMPSVW